MNGEKGSSHRIALKCPAPRSGLRGGRRGSCRGGSGIALSFGSELIQGLIISMLAPVPKGVEQESVGSCYAGTFCKQLITNRLLAWWGIPQESCRRRASKPSRRWHALWTASRRRYRDQFRPAARWECSEEWLWWLP